MIPELGFLRSVVTGAFFLRAGIYGLAAIVLALVAAPVSAYFPGDLQDWIDETSIRDLLEVMASSMLLVATFSLGSMVSAYSVAAQIATPRATRVLIDDPVAQSVISTFVGAFVFSIIGLVALSLGLYGEDGRVLLLGATALVVFVVIVTLFGWIDYLTNLVRLGAVLNKVEGAAERALGRSGSAPQLGGRPVAGGPAPEHAIRLDPIGYLTHVDMACLERVAAKRRAVLRLAALPGAMVGRGMAVAHASFAPDEEERAEIEAAFTVAAERTIDQDPRYGLVVLAEVASRALSSGVNDPGTAISVISRQQRLLTLWAEHGQAPDEVRYQHVEAPHAAAEDLCEDAFGPLARDGASMVEVGVRLQKTLRALAGLGHAGLAAAALRQSERALEQARQALALEGDVARLERLAEEARAAARRG